MELRLVASRPQESLRLYRDVLGWEEVAPGLLRAGDLEVVLEEGKPARKAEHYLEVVVPSVAEAVRAAREAGVAVLREWTEAGQARALLADPDGNLVEVGPALPA